MLTIYCPQGETSTWITHGVVNGNRTEIQYKPRWHNGRMVLDIPRGFFTGVILPGNRGKLWEDENLETMQWLGRNDHAMEINDAFPGADRPPPVAPVVTEVAPVMIKMRAPAGCSGVSYEGAAIEIAEDGTITVTEQAAATLRSHGFLAA
jgi:hypothetical protein